MSVVFYIMFGIGGIANAVVIGVLFLNIETLKTPSGIYGMSLLPVKTQLLPVNPNPHISLLI